MHYYVIFFIQFHFLYTVVDCENYNFFNVQIFMDLSLTPRYTGAYEANKRKGDEVQDVDIFIAIPTLLSLCDFVEGFSMHVQMY